jgi:amidohydrolase
MSDLLTLASARLDAAVALRREIHAHPELGLELPRTQERVLDALDGLPLKIRRGTATTSVVAVLEGDQPGPTVLLRGDMDALPMPENAEVEYASTVEETMHACGHDLHTAMLVGAAHLLTAQRKKLHGRVLFMFQPGEEGAGGARVMLEEGLLDGVGEMKAAFAIHVASNVASGVVAAKGGTQMASADEFFVTVKGRGGHASMPHDALDPIPVACEIVLALQSMITRRVSVFDPAVLTVGSITAGTTSNVIPETARLHGTMRAVSERTRALIHDQLRRVAEGIAAAHGA